MQYKFTAGKNSNSLVHPRKCFLKKGGGGYLKLNDAFPIGSEEKMREPLCTVDLCSLQPERRA